MWRDDATLLDILSAVDVDRDLVGRPWTTSFRC